MTTTRMAVLFAVTGLLVGAGGGYAMAAATVEPETIVETETLTETVEVTPQVCVETLDASAEVHTLLIDKWSGAFSLTDDLSQAADFAEMEAIIDSLGDTTELDAATERWFDTRRTCLDAAQ